LLLPVLIACSSRGEPRTGGGFDAAARDGGAGDARAPDASTPDARSDDDADVDRDASPDEDAGARIDGSTRDASTMDASTADASVMDASADASTADASGADATTPDASPTDGAPTVAFMCVPAVSGNELNPGLVLSSMFWPGFRFEVPAGASVTTTAIGLNVQSSSAGTVFAALVRLTSMSDAPDAADLTGSDVLATTTVALPGGASSVTATAPIGVTLTPGWYAAVFGTGAFGATIASASVHSNAGDRCMSPYGYPFSIRQSDGMLILQAVSPHFVVEGTTP
jgi:hypothetical protein